VNVGVLEWALPGGRVKADLWRRFLGVLEPSPTVSQLLDGALDAEIPAAGLRLEQRRPVAGGRAQILVLSPSPEPAHVLAALSLQQATG
jgi:hypothetical protein